MKKIEGSEYSEIWNVLRAIAEQDSDLADIVKKISREKGKTGNYVPILQDFIICKTDNELLDRLINVKIVENIGDDWEYKYGRLLAFKEQHGHVVPSKLEASQKSIAFWVHGQRELYYKGLLSERKYNLLKDIGVEFRGSSKGTTTTWNAYYKDLLKFKKKYGHINVSQSGDSHALGKWCNKQRWRNNSGTLNPKCRELLDDIGFDWGNQKERTWEENLIVWKAESKKREQKRIFGKQNYSMLAWAKYQKQQYKENKLPIDKVKILKEAGLLDE